MKIRYIATISRTNRPRPGFALLLKYFQPQGRFSRRKQDIPALIIEHVAQQLKIKRSVLQEYAWTGRTIEKHRAQIWRQMGWCYMILTLYILMFDFI